MRRFLYCKYQVLDPIDGQIEVFRKEAKIRVESSDISRSLVSVRKRGSLGYKKSPPIFENLQRNARLETRR